MTSDLLRRARDKWLHHWVFMSLLLTALVLITYNKAPDNGFHLDDFVNIVDQPNMRMNHYSFSGMLNAWTGGLIETRPLPNLTFAIDWWRGGGDPNAFQRTNAGAWAMEFYRGSDTHEVHTRRRAYIAAAFQVQQ